MTFLIHLSTIALSAICSSGRVRSDANVCFPFNSTINDATTEVERKTVHCILQAIVSLKLVLKFSIS